MAASRAVPQPFRCPVHVPDGFPVSSQGITQNVREEEGLRLYDQAAHCYIGSDLTESYEYAALLNNKTATLNALKRYDEAEEN